MKRIAVSDFRDWRTYARGLLRSQTAPGEIVWEPADNTQAALSGMFEKDQASGTDDGPRPSVPKAFLALGDKAACHRDPLRWTILYRVLWRLTHGERNLLEIDVDDDIRALNLMAKAVARDIHKMHAFVRFRRTQNEDGTEHFIAWHQPDHHILTKAAPFFTRRFGSMHWTILTPEASASWDAGKLSYGPGVPASQAPQGDALEDLWRAYYASVFNPARLKVKMMKSEMPVRHWRTLPEAQLIPALISQAGQRTTAMLDEQPQSAARFIPKDQTLEALAEAVRGCQACELFRFATQTVFGEGIATAPLMLVGEQPGDQEDLQGRPFVGPAGQLLDRALRQAGIQREQVYLTNAVKHFKFTREGKRRIHQKPGGTEISACRPWLEAELRAVQPKLIVCLGATASQSVLGRQVRIQQERGVFLPHRSGGEVMITIHPSALLRLPTTEQKELEFEHLVNDLKSARARLL